LMLVEELTSSTKDLTLNKDYGRGICLFHFHVQVKYENNTIF